MHPVQEATALQSKEVGWSRGAEVLDSRWGIPRVSNRPARPNLLALPALDPECIEDHGRPADRYHAQHPGLAHGALQSAANLHLSMELEAKSNVL